MRLRMSLLTLLFALALPAACFGVCGDGVVDSGEQCDDGGLADGDCCSSACLVEPEGGSCDDANSCTTGDHCEAGVCTASTQPDGASCNDGDACTQADVCTSGTCISGAPVTCDEVCQTCDPYQGCVYAPRYECSVYPSTGRLLLKDATDPSRDTLSIDLSGSTWLGVEDLGDPRSDTRYDVCVYDGDGLIGHGTVEPGGTCGRSTCWTPLPDGYRYRSYGTNALDSLVVRLKQNGKLTLKIRGKGEGLGIGPLPVTGDYPAIELRGSNGLCVGTGFPGWQRNGPTVAEARKRLFDW
jgi:cysteine-rich repeat protein